VPTAALVNVEEFEAVARGRLDEGVYGYFAGGADDEVTVRGNREAFRRLWLKYRVLVDASRVDTSGEILGAPVALPVILAPAALPAVVEAVAGRVPIVVDGGIRRGTDVLKALALGAVAAAIGRPLLWGLAAAGEKGVFQVLAMLREELALAMALAGCPSLSDIDRSLVAFPR